MALRGPRSSPARAITLDDFCHGPRCSSAPHGASRRRRVGARRQVAGGCKEQGTDLARPFTYVHCNTIADRTRADDRPTAAENPSVAADGRCRWAKGGRRPAAPWTTESGRAVDRYLLRRPGQLFGAMRHDPRRALALDNAADEAAGTRSTTSASDAATGGVQRRSRCAPVGLDHLIGSLTPGRAAN